MHFLIAAVCMTPNLMPEINLYHNHHYIYGSQYTRAPHCVLCRDVYMLILQAPGGSGSRRLAGAGGEGCGDARPAAHHGHGDRALPHGPQRRGRGLRPAHGDRAARPATGLCGRVRLPACLSLPHQVYIYTVHR